MSKVVSTRYVCDRCGGDLVKECGLIIEGMTFAVSGYDPRGSGGTTERDKEFCYCCSKEFYEWFHNRADAVPHKPTVAA